MRPSRQVVLFDAPLIFGVDYFNPTLSVEVVVIAGGPATVELTNDDVNDLSVTATWFPAPPPLNNVVVSTQGPIELNPVRFLRFTCLNSGSASFLVLQASGRGSV